MTDRTPQSLPAEIFPDSQWQHLDPLIEQLQPMQALWLSGYLAARASANSTAKPQATSNSNKTITIAYGSETGNGEQLARELYQAACSAGHSARLIDLADLKVRQLRKLSTLWLIASTHGDGDPPLGAIDFHRDLLTAELDLSGLQYAVLALGDSSYEQFCQTGIEMDQQLAALGATRLAERIDCDVDYATAAQQWSQQRLAALPATEAQAAPNAIVTAATSGGYSKQKPLQSEVLEQLPLSSKNRHHGNYHLSVAIEEGSLALQPGDAVGVFADNPTRLINAVLAACELNPDTPVKVDKQSVPLVDALRSHFDLSIAGKNLLQQWAQWSADSSLLALTEDNKQARAWLKQHHLLDLLQAYPAKVPSAQALLDVLRPLQPRLYDVANHIDADSDELHLLVKRYDYSLPAGDYPGIASHYLCDLHPGDPLRIYPHRNARFALPQQQAPVILIGYGTGLAPYRAYLQARAARADSNTCWLVLGERQYEQDFLYQTEWHRWLNEGVLSYLDPVFADERPARQLASPLIEQAEQFKQWLNDGAVLYFCGDKATLNDCEQQLQQLVASSDDPDGANTWQQLAADRRIHRNLY